ncbi:TonB-dependent receptor plug domain-containing protein [Anaeroglobus geminatus]|uniref:TonB-dependent receptor plug domain protein n=1 Tax=Anaeroglobus geminatus F0357 TaxID=861450 RepID=G9YJG0_9FIRM|nr:TonB-dependent receptor plug domain-containing protein [Anaeroglobus geminatus]EHM38590.1 TonB-dependent receptor plug domain protein [Anaeroglobus geminatus F0357]
MKKYVHRGGMHALLACAVVTWLGMPICAAESPSGGDSRVETGDIVVKVDAAKEAAKSESQSTTVITKEDIARKQAKSVEDIIFSETGMARSVDAMGRVTVSIRGAEPRHTLILVDGQPVMGDFAKYSGQADELQRLGTENIERIEIIRGAASAKYGADAIGGVINVITRRAASDSALRLNFEGRRIKDDKTIPPYKNFFLRADSGRIGKFQAAIYGGKRDIMPIYSEKLFYHGVNTADAIRNSLRYFGDIKNIGILGSYAFDDRHMLDFSLDRANEEMDRFTKHSEDAPDPVIHYKRNIDRDTYRMSYQGIGKYTDWKIDFNYAKMTEDDVTLSSVAAFSKYEGKNTLRYLDHILHKEWSIRTSAHTVMNDRHLLTYGLGFSKETGEGSRLKSAKNIRTRYIDPWDYDKNLHSDEDGTPSSSIKDRPMYLNENGIPQYDKAYTLYGYKDASGKTQVPPYTFEDYENGTNDDKIPLFADELRRENPAELFFDEDGDPLDDDTIMRRYYGDYSGHLHGTVKNSSKRSRSAKIVRQWGRRRSKNSISFCRIFGRWELIRFSCRV